MTGLQLHDEFASFGNVIDTYIPNKVKREDGDKAIQATHGKVLWGNLVSVNWAKFQKRNRQGLNRSKWIWVPKCRNADDTAFVGQEGVRLNGGNVNQNCSDVVADNCKNIAENGTTHTQNNQPNEECGEQNICSDDNRTISQPMGTRNSRLTFIGKLLIQRKCACKTLPGMTLVRLQRLSERGYSWVGSWGFVSLGMKLQPLGGLREV
ncbi:hypothetical protein Cgig2_031812 [Carnegiea gigantea]|uniref:Uncharacterized protein n=1 Tax=Carnegiea gigantea TaxID=171969 RepID=A0A9Q1KR99_9CARY|nr:hypothetical protein Cgig2_031812 [Carnegiea gigantea]